LFYIKIFTCRMPARIYRFITANKSTGKQIIPAYIWCQPVAYMDKLLRAWAEIGARSVEAARREHDVHIAARNSAATQADTRRSSKEVAEHRYGQRAYAPGTLDALAIDLFADEEDLA